MKSAASRLWIIAYAAARHPLACGSADGDRHEPDHGSCGPKWIPPRNGTLRRLTVHADSVRADLVLPASAPLESLVPAIVDIISGNRGYQAEPVAIRYRLSLPGGIALDPSKTLAEIGIRDGAALILTSPSTGLPAPRLDDAAEAVSQSLAGTERRWTPWTSRLVAVLTAGWLDRRVHTNVHQDRN